ncbi:MAG: hypothetical protein Kapaf2KO_10210 [Candidatus Kapaibacteriales bacterium]
MKFFNYIFLFLFATSIAFADDAIKVNQQGKITNLSGGTITVKANKSVQNQGEISNEGEITIEEESNINSEGTINNIGRITSYGQIVRLNQASIGGIVIMDTRDGFLTNVPTVEYNHVELKGAGRKILDKNNTSASSLSYFSSDAGTPLIYDPDQLFIARGEVNHNGITNPTENHGLFGLYGGSAQNIYGTGAFQHIDLDNSAGADVINGGGFRIGYQLELTDGEMRNTTDNNFKIGNDDTNEFTINKVNGSIATHPENDNGSDLTVNYLENSGFTHTTGGEIPDDQTLVAMRVENTLGLELTRNVEVQDILEIDSYIRTYSEGGTEDGFLLTLAGTNDPVFNNEYAEIDGSFRRTNLPTGFVHLFNNRFTSAEFETEADRNGITSVTMDIRRDTKQPLNEMNPDEKVFRNYEISGANASGDSVNTGFSMNVQYGWIHRPPFGTQGNETFEKGIDRVEDLVYQRWLSDAGRWTNVNENQAPNTLDASSDWVFSSVTITDMGRFSVGFPALDYLYLLANAILEGPWRPSAKIMDTTVFQEAPMTPPDIYPYNLDPNRERIVRSPEAEGIVDWVVLEFRSNQTEQFQSSDSVFFKTALLRYDGMLIDPDGSDRVNLQKEFTQNASGTKSIDTTGRSQYYIAVRHRNHLAVVTQNSFSLTRDFVAANVLELTSPNVMLGGARTLDPEIWTTDGLTGTALKVIDFRNDGSQIFGLAAGNVGELKAPDRRWIIGDEDFNTVWANINSEGYIFEGVINNADFNMDGIVNTTDFNISWNNRKRASLYIQE